MDGFDSNRGIILMAATNRPETLDAALVRPGRFDRQVVVDRPDITGREQILKVHARTVPLDDEINLRQIAAMTPGFVGADLANLVNEAALLAARKGKDEGRPRRVRGGRRAGRSPAPRRSSASSATTRSCGSPTTRPATPWSRAACPRPTRSTRSRSSAGATARSATRCTAPRTTASCTPRAGSRTRSAACWAARSPRRSSTARSPTAAPATSSAPRQIARKMVTEFGMSPRSAASATRTRAAARSSPAAAANDDAWSEQTAREIDLEVRRDPRRGPGRHPRDPRPTAAPPSRRSPRLLIERESIDAAELQAILDRYPVAAALLRTVARTGHGPGRAARRSADPDGLGRCLVALISAGDGGFLRVEWIEASAFGGRASPPSPRPAGDLVEPRAGLGHDRSPWSRGTSRPIMISILVRPRSRDPRAAPGRVHQAERAGDHPAEQGEGQDEHRM